VRSLGSGVNYTDWRFEITVQHIRLYHVTPLRIIYDELLFHLTSKLLREVDKYKICK